jgi:putative transcriptional regulator
MLFEERLRSVKQACSRTIQTPALIVYARSASPSMRERRINRSYHALWIGSVASRQKELYISPTEYISSRQHILDVVNRALVMIVPRLDKVLAKKKRTFYWLAKETGVSHTTLWRLKKGKAVGINFETLEKICRALRCQPGDVLFLTKDKTPQRRQASKKGRKS